MHVVGLMARGVRRTRHILYGPRLRDQKKNYYCHNHHKFQSYHDTRRILLMQSGLCVFMNGCTHRILSDKD